METISQHTGKKIKFGLFARTLIALFLLLVSALAVLSITLLNNAAKQFDEFRLHGAQSLAHSLAQGSLDALVTEDFELLERFVKSSLPTHFGAYATLSRPDGKILTSTNLNQIGKKIARFDHIVNQKPRSLTFNNRPIVEVMAKATVGTRHLATAHVAYYVDQGNFTYFGQAKDIIIALSVSLLVILLGTFVIISRIRSPILSLINTVVNTSLDSPTHMPQNIFWRNDEVGSLARSFDRVFSRLTSAHQKINEAKEHLEVRVEKRTRELADKNKALDAAQERLNSIMDNAGDSIITINDKGMIESFNLAAHHLFGYREHEILGQNVSILMTEADKSAHDQYIKRYMQTKIPHLIGLGPREVVGKRKDNSEFPMELLVNHIDLHGDHLFIGIVRDITLHKQAEKLLHDTNVLLEEKVDERTAELNKKNEELILAHDAAMDASNLKSEFLSTISHELRTPLHAISGYESLLSASELDEKQTKYCTQINHASQNLLTIINEVLDFSSFESGKLKVESEEVEIENILQDICSMFSESVDKKGLQLSYNIDQNIPDLIYLDPKRLRQVIVNLLSNAIKFTEKGSVSLKATQTNESNHPIINISISDTGIGIPKTEFDRVFSSFYQVDGSVSRSHGGTGLGLAISKKMIELMGGQILLQSTPGQGSTFTISLPLTNQGAENEDNVVKESQPQESQESQEIAEHSTVKNEPEKNIKIIVVEDNEINAELLLIQLGELGYSADTAKDGQVFLDMMKKNHYDLVLMDCQMPVLNGYDATKQHRKTESPDSHIPIIAVTANAMAGDKEKCIASGMDDYITKPVNTATLEKVIHHWSAPINNENIHLIQ